MLCTVADRQPLYITVKAAKQNQGDSGSQAAALEPCEYAKDLLLVLLRGVGRGSSQGCDGDTRRESVGLRPCPCMSLPRFLLGAVRAEATRERAVEDVQRTCKQSTQTEMTKLEQNLSEQQSGW